MRHRLRYQLLAFTATRTAINTLYRMVYPFLPVLARGLGVDLQAMSLALTLRSLVGASGPFLATVSESRGRKTGMLFGLILFFVGAILVIARPVFPVFILALILTTLGKYTFDPAMQAYLGDRTPYAQRGRAVAITELSWSLSFLPGALLVGLLIQNKGWTAPFICLATLVGIAFIVLAWMLPRDIIPHDNPPRLAQNLRLVFTYVPALAGLAVGFSATVANEVVNLIFGVWMEDSFGLEIAGLGVAAAAIGLAELCGETLVIFITDRLGKTRAIGIGLALNSLAALALTFLGKSLPGALLGLFLFYFTFEFTLVSIIPLMTEVLPSARTTMMAANVTGLSLGRAAGALLAPSLYGSGILVSGFAAVLFNLLGLFALRLLPSRLRG